MKNFLIEALGILMSMAWLFLNCIEWGCHRGMRFLDKHLPR